MNVNSIFPKMMTETAIAAMKSLEPEVKSCPRRNMILFVRLAPSPKRSPMNP